MPRAAAYLNCLPSLAGRGVGIDVDAQPGRAQLARQRQRVRRRVASSKNVTTTSTPAAATASGNMPRSVITTIIRSSPSEKPQAGTTRRRTCRSGRRSGRRRRGCRCQVGHGDLHDRAGVVRQAARQPRHRRGRVRARRSPPASATIAREVRHAPRRPCLRPTPPGRSIRRRGVLERRQRLRAGRRAAMPRAGQLLRRRRRRRSCRACRARPAPRRAVPASMPAASSSAVSTRR